MCTFGILNKTLLKSKREKFLKCRRGRRRTVDFAAGFCYNQPDRKRAENIFSAPRFLPLQTAESGFRFLKRALTDGIANRLQILTGRY